MSFFDRIWPRTAITSIQLDVAEALRVVLEIKNRLRTWEQTMAADRDLATTILAALPAIAEGIAARDSKIAELQQQLDAAGVAAAADEAEDTAAFTPVKEAVDAIVAALTASPATPDTAPDPIPVEDIPAAVDQAAQTEAGDPGPVPDDAGA